MLADHAFPPGVAWIDGDCRPGPTAGRPTSLYRDKHDDPGWTTPVADG